VEARAFGICEQARQVVPLPVATVRVCTTLLLTVLSTLAGPSL